MKRPLPKLRVTVAPDLRGHAGLVFSDGRLVHVTQPGTPDEVRAAAARWCEGAAALYGFGGRWVKHEAEMAEAV